MIDAVVVHYPTARDLRGCIEALHSGRRVLSSVTVVDNGAPERVPDAIARVADVISLPHNLGFACAANLGAARGAADHVLFVNPDVRVTGNVLRKLRTTCAAPGCAAASPLLLLPDGRPQVGVGGFLPGLRSILCEHVPGLSSTIRRGARNGPFFLKAEDLRRERSDGPRCVVVDWLCAACLLVRRDAFEGVGGFDETFFLYGEDIDLGHRLTTAGHRLRLRTDIVALHRHVYPTRGAARQADGAVWLDGLDRYYRKHRPRSRRGLHMIAAVGFATRALVYALELMTPASPPGNARRRVAAYARRSVSLAMKA